ncbi:uncharacterized protein MKZ38_009276 [Zalerion maritima]|uniref:Uncharacterized protein n=1 Tax=Zalerion maritima TaxID=339359 RepID=A0AAD5RGC2_9PEZI|nr:uncharacterized protein MKZ38_009276 [Zalerion maritima]
MTIQYDITNSQDGQPGSRGSPLFSGGAEFQQQYTTQQMVTYTGSPTEPRMPTPISCTGSPPLPQRGPKTMQQQPFTSPPTKQLSPSPPGASGLYWSHPPYHTLNGNTSQSSSPRLLHHPHVTEAALNMSTYVHTAEEPTTTDHFNAYSLPTATTPEIPQFNPYPTMDGSLGIVTLGEPTIQPLGHPGLVSSGPFDFRPLMTVTPALTSPKRRRGPTKRKAPAARAKGATGKGAAAAKKPKTNDQKSKLKLKPGTPEEAKFLLRMRIELDSEKGKGMWDMITDAYAEKYGAKPRPTLQMRIERLSLKWFEWDRSEDDILKEAVKRADDNYFATVLQNMKELGGTLAWDYKPKHIKKRMVEIGLADMSDDDTQRNRRKRKAARRRSSASANPAWPMDPTHSHHTSFDSNAPAPEQPFPKFENYSEEEDEFIEKLLKQDPDSDWDERRDSAILEVPGTRANMEVDDDYQMVHHDQSQRVALQACQELMQHQGPMV